jgi:hypothetical protein
MGTIITVNPISPTRPRDSSTGGLSGVPVVNRGPQQILGLNPLTDCLASSCRTWDPDCCYKIPTFAEIGSILSSSTWDSTLNDQNSYFVQFPSYSTGSTNTSVITFILQKSVANVWTNQAVLSNNTYGTYYPFYSLPIYYYTGYNIEWRKVLNAFGEGCYRVYINYGVNGREGCLTGEPHNLMIYSCKRAHGTVRMDAKLYDGDIANIDIDGSRNSICGINIYDSSRFYGFFGYEESDEEKRQIELTDGYILKTRDELVQSFKLTINLSPKWLHDRFKAYGTMSDELRVTDYNWNNSDYNIKRKLVVREGGYKPKYKIGSRLSTAEVVFKEGYQNVSRSLCCGSVYGGK